MQTFSIGRVFGNAFEALKRNPVTLIVFPTLIMTALGAWSYITQTEMTRSMIEVNDPSEMMGTFMGSFGLMMVLSILIGAFLAAAMYYAAVEAVRGNNVSIGEALSSGLKYMFPMLLMMILMGLGFLVGFMLLIVPGIILMLMWSVAGVCLVDEGTGITGSLGRSNELTKGHKWKIFGLFLIFGLIVIVVMLIVGMIINAMVPMNELGIPEEGASLTVPAILQGLIQGVYTAFSYAMYASLYNELKLVKGGADTTTVFD